MGRHKDVVCPECGFRYSASGSEEADRDGNEIRDAQGRLDPYYQVVSCTCPICRFHMSVDPLHPDAVGPHADPSYSGDRIWVSKIPYHLMEPRRWDVIVFRFPDEAQTYYIKRLVGLPNEEIRIFHGDIFTRRPGDADFVIQRKPPEKVRAMAQVVHDNDYVSEELKKQGWPLRWQPWKSEDVPEGNWKVSDDTRSYQTDGTAQGETWIRYQHLVPSEKIWYEMLESRWSPGQPPRPQLITDFYAFNTRVLRGRVMEAYMLGLHWVGDLILDCELDSRGTSGIALLDLVKGGRHFRCAIDVADGKAELTIDGLDGWRRTAQTAVRGQGKHRVMFANADRQLLLWVDDKVVTFDSPPTYEGLDNEVPQAGSAGGGDLAPLGIGSRGAAISINHLRVWRDIYYIAVRHPMERIGPINDYQTNDSTVPTMTRDELAEFFCTPARWTDARGASVFDQRQPATFPPLGEDQFFVLGDNSPYSADARLWTHEQYVARDLLVGKALFVYWPHPLNLNIPATNISIPIVPNFPKMGLIR
jgi:signal peptidase I